MNYLAHLYLSDPNPLAWSGSLMGDFVKGAVPTTFPAELSRHLKLHRYIDSYTQRSEIFQHSRKRLDVNLRYGRSVLIDVFFDYFLACNWSDYSHQPLASFAQEVYGGLHVCYNHLSPKLQQQLPRMIESDWLTASSRPETIQRILLRLEERLNHKLPLAAGFTQLELLHDELEGDFKIFMTEVEADVANWKQAH